MRRRARSAAPDRASCLFRLAATSRLATHAAFLEDDFQRAEVGERGLKQVEPNEGCEPKPVRAVVVRQQQTGENESSAKPANDQFHRHMNYAIWLRAGRKSAKPLQPSHLPDFNHVLRGAREAHRL